MRDLCMAAHAFAAASRESAASVKPVILVTFDQNVIYLYLNAFEDVLYVLCSRKCLLLLLLGSTEDIIAG